MFSSSRLFLDQPTEKLAYNSNLTLSTIQKKYYIKQEITQPQKSSKLLNGSALIKRKAFENQIKASYKQRALKKPDITQSSINISTQHSDLRTVESILSSTHMAFIAAPDELLNKSLGKDYLSMKSFTPFSTILQNNLSWHSFAKQNTEEKTPRDLMTNQLCFNKTQQNFLIDKTQKEQIQNIDTLIDSYRQRQARFNLPKIRIKNHQEQMNALAKQGNNNTQNGKDNNPIPIPQQNEEDDDHDPFNMHHKEQAEKKLNNLRFYWYCITDDCWRPEIREFPTLTYINGKLYLYGGNGLDLFNQLCYLDFDTWKWTNLDKVAQLPEGRYGHSSHQYKKDLLVFGGEKKYNSHMKMRQCFNDIQIYDFGNNVWNQIRTFGDIIENRRNHTSIVLNKFLFIFGGINNYNKHLADLMVVNLETFKCNFLQVEGVEQKGIAFHQMSSVFRGEVKLENPYYNLDYKKIKHKKFRKIKEEGLYVFGGLYQNGDASNQLRILKLGQKPTKWINPETKGIPPLARYQHGQHYYEELNILIIYGGRNDNSRFFRSSSISQNGIMGDICILDIENLNWIQIEENGLKNLQKCAFSSCMIGSKIIVFGGYKEQGFVNADLYTLELDQQKNRKLIKDNGNPLISGPQKHCISVSDIVNNHTDLFDVDEQSKLRKRNQKVSDNSMDDLSDTENAQKKQLRTYQPLPQSILKQRKNSRSQTHFLDQPKFKHNDKGIPSLCSVSEEEDEQIKQIAEQQPISSSSKNKKVVSYAKL